MKSFVWFTLVTLTLDASLLAYYLVTEEYPRKVEKQRDGGTLVLNFLCALWAVYALSRS